MLRKPIAAKRLRYVRQPFLRTLQTPWTEMDEYNDTNIIVKKADVPVDAHKANHLAQLHGSVLHVIQQHLTTPELLMVRSSCKMMYQAISDEDVIDRMVCDAYKEDPHVLRALVKVLCQCVMNNKLDFLKVFLAVYGHWIKYEYIHRILIFIVRVGDEYMDMCRFFVHNLHLPRFGCCDHKPFQINFCSCSSSKCMYTYVVSDAVVDSLSLKLLQQIACMSNNATVLSYLQSVYNLPITKMDVWECMIHESTKAFKELMKANHKLKISQQTLIAFIRNQDISILHKLHSSSHSRNILHILESVCVLLSLKRPETIITQPLSKKYAISSTGLVPQK